MKSDFSIEKKEGYLEMKVTGKYDYGNFIEFPTYIRTLCEREQVYRVMVNGLRVIPEDLPVVERFFMAEKAANILGRDVKLAIVWHKDFIDGFMESVAQNRHGLMRLFGTKRAAIFWLLHDEDTPDF